MSKRFLKVSRAHRTAARAIEACGRIAAMAPPMSEIAMLTAARFDARAWTAADYDRAMAVRSSTQEPIGEARALEDPQLFEVWGGWVVKEALRAHVASGALSKPAGARVIAYWIMLGAKAGAKELVIALGAHAAATQLRDRAPAWRYRSAASFGAQPIPAFIIERAAALGVSPEEYQAHVYPSWRMRRP